MCNWCLLNDVRVVDIYFSVCYRLMLWIYYLVYNILQVNGVLNGGHVSDEELTVDDLPERLTVLPTPADGATLSENTVSAPSCVVCSVLVLGLSLGAAVLVGALVAAQQSR